MVIRKKAEGGEYRDNDGYIHIYVCVCVWISFFVFLCMRVNGEASRKQIEKR